jgi:hypothetical protein
MLSRGCNAGRVAYMDWIGIIMVNVIKFLHVAG